MSWNPDSGVGFFEPGCIQCVDCGWKPEDPWDTSPEGFEYVEYGKLGGQWECYECQEISRRAAIMDQGKDRAKYGD